MFEKFNLRDEAFPITPGCQDAKNWFGFSNLKAEFERLLLRSSSEPTRLCILNRGRLGAGKTHAAKYFEAHFTEVKNVGIYFRTIPIIIETSKQPQKAFIDFSNRLLYKINFSRLAKASNNLKFLIGNDKLFTELLDITGSEDIATLLSKINEENRLVSKAVLLGGGTTKELRELGVAKRLTSEHEFCSAVIGMLYLLIHGQSNKSRKLSRVLLWIDEMEDLVYFPTRYYLPFTQAMREIIDSMSKHLTLMLNFTFSEPQDLPTIENILGEAIMQRINHHIVFPQPTNDDLRSYLQELLKENRLEERKKAPLTSPFSESAFNLLIESTASRTPRFLNKLCDTLLRDLINEPDASFEKQGEISRELVVQRLPRILDLIEEARG